MQPTLTAQQKLSSNSNQTDERMKFSGERGGTGTQTCKVRQNENKTETDRLLGRHWRQGTANKANKTCGQKTRRVTDGSHAQKMEYRGVEAHREQKHTKIGKTIFFKMRKHSWFQLLL